MSIDDWPGLVNLSTGFDLKQQLETAQPAVVVGEGMRLFAVSPNLNVIEDFQTFLEA